MPILRKFSGVFASLILIALTLGVFLALAEYGPESAVRQFHRAVVMRRLSEARELSTNDSHPQAVEILANSVTNLARSGARLQIRSVERKPRQVVAEVEYSFATRGMAIPTLWVVEKRDGKWKVNADATVMLAQRGAMP